MFSLSTRHTYRTYGQRKESIQKHPINTGMSLFHTQNQEVYSAIPDPLHELSALVGLGRQMAH